MTVFMTPSKSKYDCFYDFRQFSVNSGNFPQIGPGKKWTFFGHGPFAENCLDQNCGKLPGNCGKLPG